MNGKLYQRTGLLVGEEGLIKLKNASIMVVGLGGVGSFAVESLARCGIGHITIVDHDVIEESNLNRQLPALCSTVAQYKVDVVADRMLRINPRLKIPKYSCSYNSDNGAQLLNSNFDYVVDAIDSIEDKVHLIKTCLQKNIPIISSMGTARRINPLMLTIADIKESSVCPLARKLRKELRKEGISEGFDVVFSLESPLADANNAAEDHQLGSMVFVPASAGILMGSFVVKKILGL